MKGMIVQYDENDLPLKSLRRVPMADILTQYRKRWVIHTHIGDLVLRHIRYLEVEKISLDLIESSPEYEQLVERSRPLWAMAKAANEMQRALFNELNSAKTPEDIERLKRQIVEAGLNAEQMKELSELGKRLRPYMNHYAVPCFVEPKLESVDDFDALISQLYEPEQEQVFKLLTELTKAAPDKEVAATSAVLSKQFNIPLSKDMDIENMTAQAATVLSQTVQDGGQHES